MVKNRPSKVTLALMVAASLLLGVGVALLTPDRPGPAANQRPVGDVSPSASARSEGRPEPVRTEPAPAPKTEIRPHDAPELGQVPAGPVSISIVFVDENEVRVQGVQARVIVNTGVRLPSGHTDQPTFNGESDANGVLPVTALPGHKVSVQVNDSDWGALPLEFDCRAADHAAEKVIRLHPLFTVAVRAQFEDGEPVTSSGGFHALGVLNTFDLDEAGYAKVRRVPSAEGLTCTIYSGYRAGYARHQVPVSAHELKTATELLIVVPKSSEPFGMIRLLFDEPTAAASRVIIECSNDGPQEASIRRGSRSWDSPKLLSGPEYRITLVGELAWQSPWVGVPTGAMTELRVVPTAGANVRATLLTETGAPLSGGTAKLKDGGAVAYGERNVPRLPAAMLSNDAGEIVLRGIPAGSHVIEFHAWGRATVQVSVVVAPGETLELGSITLDPALGSIRVALVGVQEGKSYDVYLTDFNAAILAPATRTAGQEVTFERLTLHKYVVAVTLAGGGTVASADAFLDESNTTATVNIDVSDLKP